MAEIGLRNDVYRRPLETAMLRIGIGAGWRCADVGAGAGDVTIALAELVGKTGRIYAVDSDPQARDFVAGEAAARHQGQVVAITQQAEDLLLPEKVDLVFCRFLLMHVDDPLLVLQRMTQAVRPGGYVVVQEPVTSTGRVGGQETSMPAASHPDVGAIIPSLIRQCGLDLLDAWAEAPAGAGNGPITDYLESLTGVHPGDDPIILPSLVTSVGQLADQA